MKNIVAWDLNIELKAGAVAGIESPLAYGSVVSNNCRFVSVMRSYHERIGGMSQISELSKQYLDSDNIRFVYNIVDSEVDLISNIFKQIHSLNPDMVVTWHMGWEGRTVMERLEKHGVKPESVLCPPNQPEDLRLAKFIEGPSQRRHTLDPDKCTPIHPADRKNRFEMSTPYRFLDAMYIYRKAYRQDNDPTYQLAKILDKHDIYNPIANPFPDLQRLAWHVEYQKEKPLLYLIDGVVDQTMLLELDNKTGFLSNIPPDEESNH